MGFSLLPFHLSPLVPTSLPERVPEVGNQGNHFNLLFFLLLAMHHKKHFLQALVFINSIFKETQVGEAVWVGFESVWWVCFFISIIIY